MLEEEERVGRKEGLMEDVLYPQGERVLRERSVQLPRLARFGRPIAGQPALLSGDVAPFEVEELCLSFLLIGGCCTHRPTI